MYNLSLHLILLRVYTLLFCVRNVQICEALRQNPGYVTQHTAKIEEILMTGQCLTFLRYSADLMQNLLFVMIRTIT